MSDRQQLVPIRGASIIEAFETAGIETIVALPDIVTCETVLWPLSSNPSFLFVPVCKEDEGVSICASLSYCNQRAVLLIQHTGFLDSINAIRAIAVDYQLPVVMVVGLQGAEPDTHPGESNIVGIRALGPICDALELRHTVIADEKCANDISDWIEHAYQESSPCVIFLPQPPV